MRPFAVPIVMLCLSGLAGHAGVIQTRVEFENSRFFLDQALSLTKTSNITSVPGGQDQYFNYESPLGSEESQPAIIIHMQVHQPTGKNGYVLRSLSLTMPRRSDGTGPEVLERRLQVFRTFLAAIMLPPPDRDEVMTCLEQAEKATGAVNEFPGSSEDPSLWVSSDGNTYTTFGMLRR